MNIQDKEQLRTYSKTIFTSDIPIELLNATEGLFSMLSRISGLNSADQQHTKNIMLPKGKALAPYWAGMCIKDYVRTQKLVKGLAAAIDECQQKFPGESVQILYVGCGPFASLALPLMALFDQQSIRFSMLEVNEQAIDMLHNILEYFELKDYVSEIIHADATTCALPENYRPHIIITETMQHALESEPQVSILMNFAKQAQSETIFIPQSIDIDAVLMNMKKLMDKQTGTIPEDENIHIKIGNVFNLNKGTAKELVENETKLLFEKTISIPDQSVQHYPWLTLLTTIRVYHDITIEFPDSALCSPKLLHDFSHSPVTPDAVKFEYHGGSQPGFTHHFV